MHDTKIVFKQLNGFPYKMQVFREMQFVAHCYTAVSCQPILMHSVYKNSAVYLSGARVRFFNRYAIWVPRLYRYHKLRKTFSKFYRRHFELIEKYHVSLEKLMQQGICNPEFYGNLVYKFKKIIGNPNLSNLFKRIVNRFKRARYTLDITRLTACLGF